MVLYTLCIWDSILCSQSTYCEIVDDQALRIMQHSECDTTIHTAHTIHISHHNLTNIFAPKSVSVCCVYITLVSRCCCCVCVICIGHFFSYLKYALGKKIFDISDVSFGPGSHTILNDTYFRFVCK